jgi:hypothetical protein
MTLTEMRDRLSAVGREIETLDNERWMLKAAIADAEGDTSAQANFARAVRDGGDLTRAHVEVIAESVRRTGRFSDDPIRAAVEALLAAEVTP